MTFKFLHKIKSGPKYEVAELLFSPPLIVNWVQPGKFQGHQASSTMHEELAHQFQDEIQNLYLGWMGTHL